MKAGQRGQQHLQQAKLDQASDLQQHTGSSVLRSMEDATLPVASIVAAINTTPIKLVAWTWKPYI